MRLRGFVFCPGGSAVWPQCWLCAVCAVGHIGCCVGGEYPVPCEGIKHIGACLWPLVVVHSQVDRLGARVVGQRHLAQDRVLPYGLGHRVSTRSRVGGMKLLQRVDDSPNLA